MSYRREVFKRNAAKFLQLDETNVTVLNMEKGVFNSAIEFCRENGFPLKWTEPVFLKRYSVAARRILANISYTNNAPTLREKIKGGILDAYTLVKLTKEELNPEEWEALHKENLDKAIPKEEVQEEGLFKCNRCKSMKTSYYQLQTRSADESMTSYVTCLNCNMKWKC